MSRDQKLFECQGYMEVKGKGVKTKISNAQIIFTTKKGVARGTFNTNQRQASKLISGIKPSLTKGILQVRERKNLQKVNDLQRSSSRYIFPVLNASNLKKTANEIRYRARLENVNLKIEIIPEQPREENIEKIYEILESLNKG